MKEADTRDRILCDSIYMKCSEQANPWRRKEISGCQRLEEEGEQGIVVNGSRVSFQGDANILELVVMVAHPYEYSKCMVKFLGMNYISKNNGKIPLIFCVLRQ